MPNYDIDQSEFDWYSPEYLSSHDQAKGFGIQLDISSNQSDFVIYLFKIAKFLIGQRFDRRRINCPEQ